MQTLPRNCAECPLARPLFSDRFACGNSLTAVVRGHFLATDECHDSVLNHPEKYFQPQILTNLHLDPEWVCNRIHLNLNCLDIDPEERGIRDGERAIKVTHMAMKADLKQWGDFYYCDRLTGLRSIDPYWLALHLIHPDYLFLVVDQIMAERAAIPDYF
jgi:hypothetical protein